MDKLTAFYQLIDPLKPLEARKPAREKLKEKGYDDILIIVDQLDRIYELPR